VTWQTQPALGTKLGTSGAAVTGTWLTIGLGTSINANGTYTLVIGGRSTDAAWFATRETTHDPQLIVYR
jgi:hypothetical protein